MPSMNPGLDFDSKYLESTSVSPSCVEKLANHIVLTVSSPQFFNQSEDFTKARDRLDWLINTIEFIDLTTLAGDDSKANVDRLCYSAINPIPNKLEKSLDTYRDGGKVKCAAVCVYPACVGYVKSSLDLDESATRRPSIAAVATGFPTGLFGLKSRLEEIRYAVAEGADEIDIVIQRKLVLSGQWRQLYDEIRLCKQVCEEGGACMKTILSTGELGSLSNVYKASMVAMLAGSDFIKTSTGKESMNATLHVGIAMCRAIKDYQRLTNGQIKVGLKPAGGLKTFTHACQWIHLVDTYLGSDWLKPTMFRIGASSLLDDVINELSKLLLNRPIETDDYYYD